MIAPKEWIEKGQGSEYRILAFWMFILCFIYLQYYKLQNILFVAGRIH